MRLTGMIRLLLVQGKLDSRPRQLANDERDSLRNPLVRLSRMVVLDNYSLATMKAFCLEEIYVGNDVKYKRSLHHRAFKTESVLLRRNPPWSLFDIPCLYWIACNEFS
jgi:hypothetical protein